jgi:protease II
MNKKFIHAFCFAGIIVLSACNNQDNKSTPAPEGMHLLDLTRYGKPFAIFVPDTTKAMLEVAENTNGALEIKVGKNFAISINEQEADLELKKQDVKEDEVNKLRQFIAEEPGMLVWESEIIQPEFHFVVNKHAGNSAYSFEDAKSEAGTFGKEAILRMVDCSKNIQEKPRTSS